MRETLLVTDDATPEGSDEPSWRDLTENKPGESARQRADELRRADPVRSVVARILGVRREDRDWRVGADGEEEVARRLQKLGADWRIIHAVPVGDRGSDIDHVVIGPPGVFTLNTKNHSKCRVSATQWCVYVNGQKTDYVRNSRHEATRASKLLSTACGHEVVAPGLIVVMAAELTVKAQPADVRIVSRKRVANWLAALPPLLEPDRVDEIYEYARRDTTWRSGKGPNASVLDGAT